METAVIQTTVYGKRQLLKARWCMKVASYFMKRGPTLSATLIGRLPGVASSPSAPSLPPTQPTSRRPALRSSQIYTSRWRRWPPAIAPDSLTQRTVADREAGRILTQERFQTDVEIMVSAKTVLLSNYVRCIHGGMHISIF